MLGIAIVCVYLGIAETSREVSGAYRDSAHKALQAATDGLDGQTPRQLVRSHPDLQSAAIYRRTRGAATASAGKPPARAVQHRLAIEAIRSGRPVSARQPHAELLASPLPRGGALVVAYDMRPAQQMQADREDRSQRVAFALTAVALFLVLFLVTRALFRPLDKLRAAARAIGEGNLATRLDWSRTDELGQLAAEFDTMAARLEEHQHGLEDLAHRDPLTGLPNHRRFQELLGDALAEAREQGGTCAVVLLDIDAFERINDAHGHPYGDELLVGAAAALRDAIGDRGVAARVGGDEFGVIAAGAGGRLALELAEEARTAVERSAPVRGALRCSAGLACYPTDAKSAGTLLQLAGGALAWAKDSGRGRARRYDPGHVFVVTEEQREDFAAAIVRPDAIRPQFQPIVALGSGEPVGYEALARFDSGGGQPPSWWFAQAHRFGLGAALEARAVRAALEAGERPAGTFLAINLSPSALASREVGEALPDDLDGLVLEITEEERVLDVEVLQRHLEPLRARGARIAVDDAGEGYAGLQQVMSMRADMIKLDRALVADVHADPAKVALIGSLVHFARGTGASICAEGIETLQELRVLVHLGVTYGQGWALARPGEPWPRVNAEAAELCRDLRSADQKVVPMRRGA